MSLFASLNVGITGLKSQSNVLGIISDNLSNINTVGYKKTAAQFQTLVTNDLSAGYSPGGAEGGYRSLNNVQGPVSRTESPTDIAISGNGFFTVRAESPTTGGIFYSRSGSFTPDKSGNFKNGAGFFLQGWLLSNQQLSPALSGNNVAAGTAQAALRTVNVQSLTQTPIPTSLVSLFANLQSTQTPLTNSTAAVAANLNAATLSPPTSRISASANLNSAQTAYAGTPAYNGAVSGQSMASGGVIPHFSRTVTVYDNAGAAHTANVGFLKTSANTWAVELFVQPAADVTQADGQLARGNVTFNADGTLASISAGLSGSITASWSTGGGGTTLAFNPGTLNVVGGVLQNNSGYSGYLQAMPDYNPTSTTKSMASGGVTPNFTGTVNVVDNAGTARTLTVGYLKTGPSSWAIEVYAQPLASVTTQPGFVTGQVAYGTASFNSNGTLASVSPGLSNPIQVGWNGAAQANSLSINWMAAGASAGLTQNNAAFSASSSTVKNYDPTSATKNMAQQGIAPHYSREINLVDSAGKPRTITAGFLKTGINTWAVEIYAGSAAEIGSTTPQIAKGTLTFNGDGSLASVSASLTSALNIAWATPAGTANSFTLNFGTPGAAPGTVGATVFGSTNGVAQLDKAYGGRVEQNGFQSSNLKNVEITEDGFVVGIYENGGRQKLYKIPLAQFIEPNKLQGLSGNIFAESSASGAVYYSGPGQGAAGSLFSSSLENSNVETEGELVNMIVAQRSYQANSKTISTTDSMLETLTQIL